MNPQNEPPRSRKIPAVARLDAGRKPSRQQRLKQHRQAAAWKRKAGR
jgi:hypothetical protein